MNEICFVTGNNNKLKEVQSLLSTYKIISLTDLSFFDDIPETENTIRGNAFLKASFVNKKFNIDCFSDDTGLFIDSLGGSPGVKSARYASENSDSEKNIELVLKNLRNNKNRNAYFKTVICLIKNDKTHYFEGKVYGTITRKRVGKDGFGYDPIFIPDGYNQTFGEMESKLKMSIDHRFKAYRKIERFFN